MNSPLPTSKSDAEISKAIIDLILEKEESGEQNKLNACGAYLIAAICIELSKVIIKGIYEKKPEEKK